MGGYPVDTHLLLAEKYVIAHLEHGHRCIKVSAHEIGQTESGVGRAQEQRTAAFLDAGNRFSRIIVVRQQAAAVRITFESVIVKQTEKTVSISTGARQFAELTEKADPCVEIGRAVVAVNHGDGIAVRRRDHVYDAVRTRQILFQNYHRERRSSGRDIARTRSDSVCRHHAGARVSFRRTERYARLQMSGLIQQCGSLLREASGVISGH